MYGIAEGLRRWDAAHGENQAFIRNNVILNTFQDLVMGCCA
jgi:hypothetical protein